MFIFNTRFQLELFKRHKKVYIFHKAKPFKTDAAIFALQSYFAEQNREQQLNFN